MPPKPKITEDMVLDAALDVISESGAEAVNARSVAGRLGCSTQPVMYRFSTIEALKQAAYERLNRLHTEYLLDVPPEQDPLLAVGLNYIRFAVEKPQWFRFLFQSGGAAEFNILDVIGDPDLAPIRAAMGEETGLDEKRTKSLFLTLALFVHGYASLIANSGLKYDEALAAEQLERAFNGALLAETQEEAI